MKPRVSRCFVVTRVVLGALTALLLVPGAALAADPATPESTQDSFRQANQAYDAGQFEKSRDLYSSILAVVPRNATVEYNLANSYARLHDVARAVVHYERALRSNPRLYDARANLLQIAPPTNFTATSPLLAPFQWIERRMNLNEWLWTTFLLLAAGCLAGGLWALEFRVPRLLRLLAMIFALLFLVSAGFSVAAVDDVATPTGVVLANKTIARSGPGESYLEAMELPAGAKVYAVGPPQRGWIRIQTPEGRVAFLQSGDVEWI